MNLNRLKGHIAEQGKTFEQCATFLNLSRVTFGKKINGEAKFYVSEVLTLFDLLGLSPEEKMRILLD